MFTLLLVDVYSLIGWCLLLCWLMFTPLLDNGYSVLTHSMVGVYSIILMFTLFLADVYSLIGWCLLPCWLMVTHSTHSLVDVYSLTAWLVSVAPFLADYLLLDWLIFGVSLQVHVLSAHWMTFLFLFLFDFLCLFLA